MKLNFPKDQTGKKTNKQNFVYLVETIFTSIIFEHTLKLLLDCVLIFFFDDKTPQLHIA